MLYEVKVLKPNGKVKKIIPVKNVRETHWDNFKEGRDFLNASLREYEAIRKTKNPLLA